MVHFSRSFVIESTLCDACVSRVDATDPIRVDESSGWISTKVQRQIWAVPLRIARIERKRERAREICNSSVASHRWWVEASSGAPKLARIKGGYKTSAEHQSSNQGTAATMRAFVVSSPSTISRFPDFSFSPLLPSSPFSFLLLLLSPATVFFFIRILWLSSRAYGRFLGGMLRLWEKWGEFVRQWDRDRKPGSRVPSEGGRRENAGESKREGRVHREYCVRCQCTP